MKTILLLLAGSCALFAQVINIIDTAPRNIYHGLAASKPATCGVGDIFFATDATAGQNLYFCTAANTWTQELNSGGGSGGGGVAVYTASHTLASGDAGKLVVMNCSASCSVTLPASQPSNTWYAYVTSVGSSTATVALGGSQTFNGSTSVPVLNKYRILTVYADTTTATNYQGDAPLVAGSNITFTPTSNGMTVASSGGSGTGNFPTASISGATLTIFANCTTSGSPCNISRGQGQIDQVSATNTVPSPGSGSGTVYIYWTSSGGVVGTATGVSITTTGAGPLAGTSTQGITGFPSGATSVLVKAMYNAGAWTNVYNYSPSTVSPANILAGSGILSTGDGQNQTLSIDTSVVLTVIGPVAFASLPSCDSTQMNKFAWITDGPASPAWGQAVTVGGGPDKLLLDCDGAGSWRVMGL